MWNLALPCILILVFYLLHRWGKKAQNCSQTTALPVHCEVKSQLAKEGSDRYLGKRIYEEGNLRTSTEWQKQYSTRPGEPLSLIINAISSSRRMLLSMETSPACHQDGLTCFINYGSLFPGQPNTRKSTVRMAPVGLCQQMLEISLKEMKRLFAKTDKSLS